MNTTRSRTLGDPLGLNELETYSGTFAGTRVDYANRFSPNSDYQVTYDWLTKVGYSGRITQDVVTPDFKRRIARGDIINNDYTSTFDQEVRAKPTHYNRTYWYSGTNGNYGTVWDGYKAMADDDLGTYLLSSNIPNLNADIAGLKDQAITNAHANASSSDLQGLVVAAEARKTVSSISSLTLRAFKILLAVKRLNGRYLLKQISWSELQDRYMEARYALRPLMYDVKGVIAALESSKHYSSTRVTARGSARGSYSVEDVYKYSPAFDVERSIARSLNVEVNVRAGILTDVSTSMVSVWGLDQFGESAWELIPFSFVADWFADIGKKIAGFSPHRGVTKLASWVSVERTYLHSNRYLQSDVDLGGWTTNSESWSGSKTHLTQVKERFANPSMDVLPNIYVKLDTFKLIDLAIMTKNLFR